MMASAVPEELPAKQTMLEKMVASSPPAISAELKRLLMVIEAPDNLEGLARVVRNLQEYSQNLAGMAELPSLGELPEPRTLAPVLDWVLSVTLTPELGPSDANFERATSPPRGTLKTKPIYAALWLDLAPSQMRVRDALLQTLQAHARLPFSNAEKGRYRSAREKAGRAVRMMATIAPNELHSYLPPQGTLSPTAYAAELEKFIATADDLEIRADLRSIQYLIEIASDGSKVRSRSAGGQRQSGGVVVRRRTRGLRHSHDVQAYSVEDAGAAVTIISATNDESIVADLEDAGSISSEYTSPSETFIIQFDDLPSAERSAGQNRVRAEAVARGVGRANRRLVQQVNSLSPLEIDGLVQEIASVCETPRSEPRAIRAALLIACVLATGRTLEILAPLILRNDASTQDACITRFAGRRYFELPALRLQGVQDLTAEGRAQAVQTGSMVRLPCPSLIERLFDRIERTKEAKSKPGDASDLVVDARKFLSAASKAQSARFAERRVESFLFNQILNLGDGGIAAAALITATHNPVATNPAQYLTLSQLEVSDLYLRAVRPLNRVDPPASIDNVSFPNDSHSIGSRYSPSREFLWLFIVKLKEMVRTPKGLTNSYIDIHNAMVLYTVMMSSIGCGFRAIREPILRPWEIDQTNGFAVLQDKDSQDGYNARLIWVPEVMRRQLDHFAAHTATIKNLLHEVDARRQKQMSKNDNIQLSTFPVLFLLDNHGRVVDATVTALTLAFAGSGWHLPLNSGRHYMKTQLRHETAEETLLAFMGHWRRGTEPWLAGSALDPEAYRANLAPALTRILEEDGWEPLKGYQG